MGLNTSLVELLAGLLGPLSQVSLSQVSLSHEPVSGISSRPTDFQSQHTTSVSSLGAFRTPGETVSRVDDPMTTTIISIKK